MIALRLLVTGILVASTTAQEIPAAAPAPAPAQVEAKRAPVEIISSKTDVKEDGYNFEYKTSDGSSRQEEAQLITVGDQKGISINGSYSYVAPDGQEYEVTYTADNKGYSPTIRVKPHGDQ